MAEYINTFVFKCYMEYVTEERRTTRKDLKRKKCFNMCIKRGGNNRITNGRIKSDS